MSSRVRTQREPIFFVFPTVFVFIIFLFLYVHLFPRFLIGILLLNKLIQFQISYYICFPIIVLICRMTKSELLKYSLKHNW